MKPEDQKAFEDWYFSDSSNQCGHPEEIAKNAFEAGMTHRDALVAVAQHSIKFGKPVVITNNGVPEFEITVRKLGAAEAAKGGV